MIRELSYIPLSFKVLEDALSVRLYESDVGIIIAFGVTCIFISEVAVGSIFGCFFGVQFFGIFPLTNDGIGNLRILIHVSVEAGRTGCGDGQRKLSRIRADCRYHNSVSSDKPFHRSNK